MDWGKPAPLFLRDPPRPLALDDSAWHDAEDDTSAAARHGMNQLLLSPSVKMEAIGLSPATLGLDQPLQPVTDLIPMHDPQRDFLFGAAFPSTNEGFAFRASQLIPTLPSFIQPLPPTQPPGDYFENEGAITAPFSLEEDAARRAAASVMRGFPPSEPEAMPQFPTQDPSLLDMQPDDDLEGMPPDSLLTPQQLNQMLVTPPSTASFARPTAVSPVNLLPPRSFPRSGQQLWCAAPSSHTPYYSTDMNDLEISVEAKFSSDRRKLCCIEGCKSQARAYNRCKRHGGSKRCASEGCKSQARAYNRCKRHGGSKRCASEGCTKSVQSRGLCIRHGGGSRCQEPGCSRAAQSHGRCKMHGGGRPCLVEGCDKKAHLKRLCRKHGGGSKCRASGCEKWSQRQGLCMTHSKEAKPPTTSPSNSASSVELEVKSPKRAASVKPEKKRTPAASVMLDIEM